MDPKNIGSSLKDVYKSTTPIADVFDMEALDTVPEIRPSLKAALLSFAAKQIVPQSYQNRQGRRVDICGLIDDDTEQYKWGWKFFSSEGNFYRSDGRMHEHDDTDDDLVTFLEELKETQKPLSPYIWVHPTHRNLITFFKPLSSGKIILQQDRHYVNRMGFATHIQRVTTHGDQTLYQDAERTTYTSTGSVYKSEKSMQDLVWEIKNWSFFERHDWGTTTVTSLEEAGNQDDTAPELYDPFAENRNEMMDELLRLMLRAHTLAKKLDVVLGFHWTPKEQ